MNINIRRIIGAVLFVIFLYFVSYLFTGPDFLTYLQYKWKAANTPDEVTATVTCGQTEWTITHSDIAEIGTPATIDVGSTQPRYLDIYTLSGSVSGEQVLWLNPGWFTEAGYASTNIEGIDTHIRNPNASGVAVVDPVRYANVLAERTKDRVIYVKNSVPEEQFRLLANCYKENNKELTEALHSPIAAFVRLDTAR